MVFHTWVLVAVVVVSSSKELKVVKDDRRFADLLGFILKGIER